MRGLNFLIHVEGKEDQLFTMTPSGHIFKVDAENLHDELCLIER